MSYRRRNRRQQARRNLSRLREREEGRRPAPRRGTPASGQVGLPVAEPQQLDPICFECPGCERKYRMPGHAAGKRGRCRRCRTEFHVPYESYGPTLAMAPEAKPAPSVRPEPRSAPRPPARRPLPSPVVHRQESVEADTSTDVLPLSPAYTGTGGRLFGHLFLNGLLTLITLGFYLPWAIVSFFRTVLADTRLQRPGHEPLQLEFDETGGRLFGRIFVGYLLSALTLGIYTPWFLVRMTRFFLEGAQATASDGTTYRLRFTGTGGQLLGRFLLDNFLQTITLGIYLPWALCNMQRYLVSHIELIEDDRRIGHFNWTGTGTELFGHLFAGGALTALTLGIYLPWFQVRMWRFFTRSIEVEVHGKTAHGDFHGTGGQLFGKLFVGGLLTTLTAGIYGFWMVADLLRFRIDQLAFGPEQPDKGDTTRGLRVAVGLMALAGVAACAGLGGLWISDSQDSRSTVAELTAQQRELEEMGVDTGGMAFLQADLDRTIRGAWFLLGAAVAALLGGILALLGKGPFGGVLILVAAIVPPIIAPITAIASATLVVPGILAFWARKPRTFSRHRAYRAG